MTWTPQLVALDIDGTLVDRQGVLSQVTADAVRSAAERVPVVLATGRSWSETQPVFDQLALPKGYVVVGNGTVWGSYPPKRVHSVRTFDPAPVIHKVLKADPDIRIAVEDVEGGFRLNEHFPDGDLHGRILQQSVEDLAAYPVTRIILRKPEAEENEFIALTDKLGMQGVSYAVGWSAWLDIMPEGVSKASALNEICGRLGIAPSAVLTIGDGRNDIEMLRWAGRGVAMGSAPLEVQQAADAVTGAIDQDGVATELSRYFN